MSVPSPWSVKGVQPKAREAAKDLARREGLTLGEWLNRLIGDVDEDGDVVASRENTPTYPPQNQGQAYPSEASYQQAPAYAQAPAYPQSAPQAYVQPQAQAHAQPLSPFPSAPPPRHEPQAPYGMSQRDSENGRLMAALEQLTRRLEMSAAPAPNYPVPMPPPVNAFVPAALNERIEASERRAETALGRVDANLADVRQTQAALADRLRAMEANDPNHKSLAALRGLETALARLSQQVFDVDARSEALEGRIDAKLADATAKLSQDTGLSDRVGEIEHVTQQALETLDTSVNLINQRLTTTEAMAGETSGRFADAMVDLSARLTGLEQSHDDPTTANQIRSLGDRLAGMEDVTTQAIESVDKGLGLVSERVAATEALAQATNERLVEALVDLSARLVQLEVIDSQEAARDLLSALEAKNKELVRRLETLDTKIEATRDELSQEVHSAIATGVDGRMAEIAKALADRLDVSERRNGEALEKIGAEMARASISLDQRLREIEERGSEDVAASMRTEMAKMAHAIDQRMASMERRDAAALDQAGDQFQQLAQSLGEKLDASEARAQNAVQGVSSQMEQLAQRLQARQDETAKNLVARMEDGEARSHHELQNSFAQLSAEIASAENRAKAVSAPLHRDFSAMVDRLDQVEASGLAPYTENVGFGDQAITIGQGSDYGDAIAYDPSQHLGQHLGQDLGHERGREAFGTPSQSSSFAPPVEEDFSFGQAYAPLNQEEPSRRPGFGAPFPGTDTSGLSQPSHNEPTSAADAAINFDDDPFSMASTPVGSAGLDETRDTAFDFADDMDESWSEPSRTAPTGRSDYLANARLAASKAAAERADAQKAPKKPLLGASKKKAPKNPAITTLSASGAQGDKAKPVLSPVGMAAAAALVATTGLIGFNFLNRDKSQNEMPAALNPNPAPQAPVAPAPAVMDPNAAVSSPADVAVPATPALTPNPTAATVVPVAPAPIAPIAKVKAPVVAPAPVIPPPKSVIRPTASQSPEMRRFAAAEATKAQQALARSQAAQARLKVSTPATKATGPASRPLVVPQIATPQSRAATATPNAAPKASPAVAVGARTPTPRVAVAGAPRPAAPVAGGGNARQLYDQAIARQQAGDAAGAASLMRAAADTGDARALNRLAKMYERGEGVTRDPAQARALTERAAARGSRQAMHNLGVYYAEGEGPSRDLGKAAENFRRAANKGVTDSQFNLGAMAEQGLGGQRSEREAYYWYSVAGRNGDRDAASKSRELAARLPPAEKAAEDQRAAAFQPEAGGED
jgi:localization factor PodJL